jgi:hypothetical protein
MRGPNVDNWKKAQRRELNAKTNQQANPILHTDEVLWNEFETAFSNAYTDLNKKQKAINNLHLLKMNKGDLDSYITDFNRIAAEAGYDTNASTTVEIFYKGLLPELARACLKRDQQLETMQEWIDAACTEQQKYAKLVNFECAKQGKWMLPTGWGHKSNKSQNQKRGNTTMKDDVLNATRKGIWHAIAHIRNIKRTNRSNRNPLRIDRNPLRDKDPMRLINMPLHFRNDNLAEVNMLNLRKLKK